MVVLTGAFSAISRNRRLRPSLDHLERHDCTQTPYQAVNDSRPWTYSNHQWLQSARVSGSHFIYCVSVAVGSCSLPG